ncbi:MAG: adenylyltransferase/cytidyltransferase family protein [bacterium]|nr:adenylyltransferase/cytidyltransferase family protein [bacterium]
MTRVAVIGVFDDLRARQVRFLQEAARHGDVEVHLHCDDAVRELTGQAPKFPQEERRYFLEALRYVTNVSVTDRGDTPDALPEQGGALPDAWAVLEQESAEGKETFCKDRGLDYVVVPDAALTDFPLDEAPASRDGKSVLVTGCYDWFHSGHVRFFEEVSELGRLFVVVGHDENIRLLKGEGHPMLPAEERRYMAQSVRYVERALISTGHGWLDAEPEIEALRPDMYAVNEDGDRDEKRSYCEEHGIEYVVLKRAPKEGLPRRESTTLRGF